MAENNFDSEYNIQRQILTKIGGDGTQNFDSAYSVQLAILDKIQGGGGQGVPEAPEDGKIYGRKDGDWAEVEADLSDFATKVEVEEIEGVVANTIRLLNEKINNKQNTLTAGEGITIDGNNVISTVVTDYLSFKNTSANTIYITFVSGDGRFPVASTVYSEFQYSSDKLTWNNYTSGYMTLPAGGDLYFRGKYNQGSNLNVDLFTFKFYTDSTTTTQVTEGCVKVGGDAMTLMDYEGTEKIKDYGFYNLFRAAKAIISAPKISARIIGDYACRYMFNECTNLTTAPELPATIIGEGGYYGMFTKCSGLTVAPALPSQNISRSSYSSMFSKCTTLVKAPELPSLNVPHQAYNLMFSECSSLTQAPSVLPAQRVGEGGYNRMFSKCISLEHAPVIMVTDTSVPYYAPYINTSSGVDVGAFEKMFENCTALKDITIYAKKVEYNFPISQHNNFTDFTNGVGASGTMYIAAGTTSSWHTGVDGIPSGWTVVEV